jgi:hypothetical protein
LRTPAPANDALDVGVGEDAGGVAAGLVDWLLFDAVGLGAGLAVHPAAAIVTSKPSPASIRRLALIACMPSRFLQSRSIPGQPSLDISITS